MSAFRDARAEADARLRGAHDVRVLEPSPPSAGPPDVEDDPVRAPPDGRPIVSPVPGAGTTWDEICRRDPDLAGWCAERWLGAWRRLEPLPEGFAATRTALHRLAMYAMSPDRRARTGRIGLRRTHEGFGTPFMPGERQVRVQGVALVVQEGPSVRREPLGTLEGAAALIGTPLDLSAADGVDAPPPGDPRAPLDVDPAAARALADWFGFAAGVLEEVRADSAEPSLLQLWPEHFDLAFDAGPDGARAGFGASPGDTAHAEPYLYVLPWRRSADPFFADPHFPGASLSYSEILRAPDQRAAALAVLRRGRSLA